jgi:outer membrane protein OmpA-like peptidoglycan-associated protein
MNMRRIVMVLMLAVLASIAQGCLATRKFTRNEVKTSADALNARLDKTDGEVGELRDGIEKVDTRVTGVDGRVTEVDKKVDGVQGEVSTVRGEVTTVDQKAARAQTTADRAAGSVVTLDEKFQNRNRFSVANEKTVLFKFDSATLDPQYEADLEQIATVLRDNPDALVVLEGRTDSLGASDYNVRLGERRVEAVRRYLAVEKGVPVFKIHEISFGDAKPIADNTSREGREKNRAVVVTVLIPNASAATISQNP